MRTQDLLATPETQHQPTAGEAPNLGEKRKHFRAFETNKKREMDEQREMRGYYHDHQWTEKEIGILKARRQPVITDNRIKRKIDFLVGVEQRQRRDPKAYPRTPQHEQAADVVTAGIRFVCDKQHWNRKSSDVAHDGLVGGVGVIFIGIAPAKNGPDVALKPCQADRFWYDSRSIMPDFSDARHMGLHLWLDVDEAIGRWPGKEKEIRQLVDKDSEGISLNLEQDRGEQWGDYENQRVRIVEDWSRKTTPAGEAWEYCFYSGDVVLDAGWSPYLSEEGVPDNPYEAWSPYVDEKGDRYGPPRSMKTIQDEINHRRSKLLHRITVRQVHMQTGMVDDVDKFREENAKPDGVLEHNGEWGTNVGIVDQSFEAKGEADLLALAQSSLENLGPNPGMIGTGGGIADQSGRAILAQRDSGMTELSPVFERLRDWKLRCYKKMWSRMRQAWTSERWITVTDDDNAPAFIGLNQYAIDPQTGMATAQNVLSQMDVDIILDEGPDTIVMQEELLQTISQLGEAAIGPLGKIIIELSNVPNKERYKKLMEEQTAGSPEIQAMQQRVQQLEDAMKVATIEKTQSETQKNLAAVEKTRAEAAQTVHEIINPPPPPLPRPARPAMVQ